MSYEIDNLKRELNNLRYDLTRKVDKEDIDRKINHLEGRLERKIDALNSKLDQFMQTVESRTHE